MPVNFVSLKLGALPTEEEWRCLEVFKERASKAADRAASLKLGQLSHHLCRLPDGGMRFEGTIPKSEGLELLYVDFRHLYAQEEPGNLRRNLKIVNRCCADSGMRACLKSLKLQARSSFVRNAMKLGARAPNAATATSEQVIDAMINAHIFHSNATRRRQVDELVAKFTKTGVDVLLFYAVWDFVLAAKNFRVLISDLTAENPFVLLPPKFSRARDEAATDDDLLI
ncbi:MAG TPA: hypothetical protein VFC25_06235 [Verrucomicrobiae bacterium]|nr:hypothetical protein [Verrucomicrobiae bacterium]